MNANGKIYLACLSGVLCLSGINIYANEQSPDQKIVQNINDSIHFASEAVDVKNFTQNLFTELDDDVYVLQLDEGGYLYSTIKKIEDLEQDFKAINENPDFKRITVAKAKEKLEADLERALLSEGGTK